MKKIISTAILSLMIIQLPAQKIVNYNGTFKKKKTLSEFVEISLVDGDKDDNKFVAAAAAGVVLGPVFEIVSGIVKTQIEKRQKSYIGTYSNSKEFPKDLISASKDLVVKRYAINDISEVGNVKNLMAQYVFSLTESKDGDLWIQLINVTLNRSRARNVASKNLSISIGIKVKATVKGKPKDVNDKNPEDKAIDGEGKIIIPLIKVSSAVQDFSDKDNIVGKVKIKGFKFDDLKNVAFEVSVTETNIKHVDPTIVQQILTNNSKEIQTILKAVFGVEDKK